VGKSDIFVELTVPKGMEPQIFGQLQKLKSHNTSNQMSTDVGSVHQLE